MPRLSRRAAAALLCALYLCAGIGFHLAPGPQEASSAAADVLLPASAVNWGLSFPTPGKSPVGNATSAELAGFDACYLGDTQKQVIYLTFDCGYENGYTESILDTLQKHHVPAAFFVVGNMIETAPDIIRGTPPQRWYTETIFQKENFRRMIEHYSAYPMDDYILDRMRAPLTRPGAQESFVRMLKHSCEKPSCDLGFCPAMVLIGGRDAMFSDAAREEINRYLGSAETHILKSAGHFPMETHSKALRDYLRGWIRFNA